MGSQAFGMLGPDLGGGMRDSGGWSRAIRRSALIGSPSGDLSFATAQAAGGTTGERAIGSPSGDLSFATWSTRRARRETIYESFAGLSEVLAQDVVVFPRSNTVVVSPSKGVFVPMSALGEDMQICHEESRGADGTVCVTIVARPRAKRQSQRRIVEPIDCTRELRWLAEHRKEYAGQWVALDGDRFIAASRNVKEVREAVRRSGVKLPLVVRVESDDLPFGGW